MSDTGLVDFQCGAPWRRFRKQVVLQHALEHRRRQCRFQVPEDPTGQILTVRLLIPSENTSICLTVPSETSICQQDEQTGLKRAITSRVRSLSTPGQGRPRKRGPVPSGSCCSWACPHSWGRRSPRRRHGVSASNCQSRQTTDASAVRDGNNQTFSSEETLVMNSTLTLAVAVRTL